MRSLSSVARAARAGVQIPDAARRRGHARQPRLDPSPKADYGLTVVSDSKARARPLADPKPTPKASSKRAVAEGRSPKEAASGHPRPTHKRAPAGQGQEQEPLSGTGEAAFAEAFEGAPRIDLPSAGFEGPLDLLLHLIQQHELDILDIPVGFITERYLNYIQMMRTLSIDVASEYLVMAATLTHIKSKMLLPSVPSGQEDDAPEDEEDPRAELVRRLLEYQKYKAAAGDLGERSTLGRDVFPRGIPEPVPEGVAPFADLGVFALLDAFEKVLKRANIEINHEVIFDRISITDRIAELTDKLTQRRSLRFDELFLDGRSPTRFDLIITFLSLLEMCKLRMIRVYQSDALAPIHIELAANSPAMAVDPVAEAEASAVDIAADPPSRANRPTEPAPAVEVRPGEIEDETDAVDPAEIEKVGDDRASRETEPAPPVEAPPANEMEDTAVADPTETAEEATDRETIPLPIDIGAATRNEETIADTIEAPGIPAARAANPHPQTKGDREGEGEAGNGE